MKLFRPEILAERWSTAHTVALTAWVFVVILGLVLVVRGGGSTYPETDVRKIYAAENATFRYPENWTINNCEPSKPFIELPGSIRSDYKRRGYELKIYGSSAFNCIKDRPERLDIYPENMTASATPCAPATSTEGERLSNGLYLQLREEAGDVLAIQIRQNKCYAPNDTLVLGFAFADPEPRDGDSFTHGLPRVDKDTLLKSPQYRDIKELAESIKY